jgi:integrase
MGKRSNGEGSIRKQANGTWRGELMCGYKDDGRRFIKSFSGKTRKEVQEKLRNYQNQMGQNIDLTKNITFTQLADTWYADYKSQVQPSTYSSYKYTLALLKKYFGDTLITKILPMHINKFTDDLFEREYSMSQIRKCRAMLIQIFTYAESNDLIIKNPALRAKKVRRPDEDTAFHSHAKDAFNEDEIHTLIENLPEDQIGNGIRAMLGTGMRVQELIALTSDDIAVDGSSVTINKAIKTVDGKSLLSVPKSKLSNRTIPVPEDYRDSLVYLRTHSGPARIYQPGNNELYSVGSFRHRYYTALNNIAGVRRMTPHCCRHTYATQLEKNGVPLQIIAKLMGHSSVETTGVYLRTDNDTLSEAVSALNSHKEDKTI